MKVLAAGMIGNEKALQVTKDNMESMGQRLRSELAGGLNVQGDQYAELHDKMEEVARRLQQERSAAPADAAVPEETSQPSFAQFTAHALPAASLPVPQVGAAGWSPSSQAVPSARGVSAEQVPPAAYAHFSSSQRVHVDIIVFNDDGRSRIGLDCRVRIQVRSGIVEGDKR